MEPPTKKKKCNNLRTDEKIKLSNNSREMRATGGGTSSTVDSSSFGVFEREISGIEGVLDDNDVVSMEYVDAYKELYIEGDLTCLHQSAIALCTLQRLYGKIPKIMGKGKFAEKVRNLKFLVSSVKKIISVGQGTCENNDDE